MDVSLIAGKLQRHALSAALMPEVIYILDNIIPAAMTTQLSLLVCAERFFLVVIFKS